MSPEEMIAENTRRLALMTGRYDPLAGDPADGPRIMACIRGLKPERIWIPEEMAADPAVASIIKAGSLDRWLMDKGKCVTEISVSEAAEDFNRIRCRYDFPFWAATCAYIKCKGGGEDILFRLNRPQRRLVEAFELQRRDGRPIRLILLKARQWGGSTCVQLYMAWL